MSRGVGRDVPGSEELYARKLWADFSFPNSQLLSRCPSFVRFEYLERASFYGNFGRIFLV